MAKPSEVKCPVEARRLGNFGLDSKNLAALEVLNRLPLGYSNNTRRFYALSTGHSPFIREEAFAGISDPKHILAVLTGAKGDARLKDVFDLADKFICGNTCRFNAEQLKIYLVVSEYEHGKQEAMKRLKVLGCVTEQK
jgi:hypothetical protein